MAPWIRKILQKWRVKRQFHTFQALSFKSPTSNRFRLLWKERVLCFGDDLTETVFDRHYIYHPAWAARILADTRPARHVDISSSLTFCSLVSAFIPIDFYDYLPPRLILSDLTVRHADLMNLPFSSDSIPSISCMHVIEHIGLGRYGDPLDPDGDLKAMHELKRVLAPNGTLLFVVPCGRPRIHFNAHRIYSKEQIMEIFKGLTLVDFTLIPQSSDDGGLCRNPSQEILSRQNYGCGCFRFKKEDLHSQMPSSSCSVTIA